MADDWAVVSQRPAPAGADPWAVVSQKPINAGPTSAEIGQANLDAEHARSPLGETFDMAGGIVKGGLKTAANIVTAAEHPIDTAGALISGIPGAVNAGIHNITHPQETAGRVGNYLRDLHGEEAGEQVGGLLAGGAVGKAAGALGEAVGPTLKAAVSGAPKAVEPTVKAARAAGYVLKPSEVEGANVGTAAEGMTGSPRLSIEASLKNQKVTNKLASQEVGVPAGKKLTRDVLREAAKPHQSVYREMEQLGDVDTDAQYAKDIASIGRVPGKSFAKVERNAEVERLREQYADKYMDAQDAVFEIRELRFKSKKNLDIKQIDPEKIELGKAQRQVADALENQLERHATSIGEKDLVDRFRAARVSLAKLNTVRDALTGSTGDISAQKLARLRERGHYLSGNLKLIADVADHFGEVTRDASKVKNKIPLTVLDASAGVTGAAMTAAHSPAIGIPLLAAAASRPLARKFLLSDLYQDRLAPGPQRAAAKKRIPHKPEIAGAATGFTLKDLDEDN